MRKRQLTLFVSLLAMGVAAPAQTPSQLDRVNVVRDTDTIRVEMSAKGSINPKLSTLDSPARVVVDLPETLMATGQSRIAVDANGVKDVRIGMPAKSHPSTRIVVDLEKACAYELTPGPAGKLVLSLHANPVADTKTVAANEPAPVKTDAIAAQPAASPNNYVFVEPSYQAKGDAKADVKADAKTEAPAEEPTVRAEEAAARFSDKTAAELIPVSAHAAQSSTTPAPAIVPAVNLAAEQRAQAGQQPVSAGPKYTGEPISVNLKDVDLKDFFRLIHEISGLNVVLDPQVHGTLTIVLDDVPWDQALDIVLKNNDLARELEGNVLRIATVETLKKEADARRAQVESEALAVDKVSVTRFLSYAKAKDAIITVKKFLSQRGDVVADERTNAVIINDIPKV
ncbi:MAG TPA: AMIN domain-containing protein, partial [Candidatus Binatia bacterium]|nr:AMIN domain-containing protein [Candidatus Binatia bacterium]